ncbi:MAG: DUF4342 domain-containing protein [Peptoniphilus sp. oral taxon 375]|nr:DUF4342 domain-containing protein [Peptoniphilus sp. oral taxon 375]
MITMEKIDYVMAATGKSYEEVRQALLDVDGDADQAIENLKAGQESFKDQDIFNQEDREEKQENTSRDNVQDFVDQVVQAIKDIWHRGNASRLVVENSKGDTVLSVSLNVSAIAFVIEPLIAIIGLGATVITSYNIKIYMDNGDIIDIKEYIGLKK